MSGWGQIGEKVVFFFFFFFGRKKTVIFIFFSREWGVVGICGIHSGVREGA